MQRSDEGVACVALVRDGFAGVLLLRPPVAGADGQLVEARGAHLLLDRFLGAGANGHHREHRGHADRHAEQRQPGLQPVPAERLQRQLNEGMAEPAPDVKMHVR